MIKKFIALFSLFFELVGLKIPVQAEEQTKNPILEYSLLENAMEEEIFFVDSSGKLDPLSIKLLTEEPLRVDEGTYRITKSSPGNWTASYEIRVNGNSQIIAATNLSFTVLRGSVVFSTLAYSSNRAVCNFRYKFGLTTSNQSVTATISNDRIVVT